MQALSEFGVGGEGWRHPALNPGRAPDSQLVDCYAPDWACLTPGRLDGGVARALQGPCRWRVCGPPRLV